MKIVNIITVMQQNAISILLLHKLVQFLCFDIHLMKIVHNLCEKNHNKHATMTMKTLT